MDPLGIAFIVLFLCFVAYGISFVMRRDREWREFAEGRGGIFQSGRLVSWPTISFLHRDEEIVISQPRTYGSETGATEIKLKWPGQAGLELELMPKEARFLSGNPGPEISLQDHPLSEAHVLYANDANDAKYLLEPAVLNAIADLNALWRNHDGLRLSVKDGQLTILKRGDCWRKRSLEELNLSVTHLYETLADVKSNP